MSVKLRKFQRDDVPLKVEWVNNPANNEFLHYDIPIEISKTELWFQNNSDRSDRYDGVIEVDELPVGLVGLLSIDQKHKKAEFYIMIGNTHFKGRGIAKEASRQMLNYGFYELGLSRIYLFTEVGNEAAKNLYERIGFIKEGCLRADVFSRGKFADRYVYSILKEDWERAGNTV